MSLPAGLTVLSAASRWRTRIANARPEWVHAIGTTGRASIDRGVIDAAMERIRGSAWRDEAHLHAGLRMLRCQILAALIDRDLDGRADLTEVMGATTALAEASIAESLRFHAHRLAAIHGVPCGRDSALPQDLIVVGMGKLGGAELNVSSDVDLIFVFGEDGDTRAIDPAATVRTIANEDFFTRLGRRLIASLAEVAADGFVFRVDMRLRPDGDSGPLVTSFASLERYLVTSARDWERFAWIKARVVSPAVFGADPSNALDPLVTPFVYRRYLDFGAIDALRRLHGQIRDEATRREAVRQGRTREGRREATGHSTTRALVRIDVKLGRGGIREIEFIAQHFQLIRGGRDRSLRLRPTRAMLTQLVDDGLIDARSGRELQAAYAFLRNIEHRLQYLDDAQTHALPSREAVDDCERVAAMSARLLDPDHRDFDGLVDALEGHRRVVEMHFGAIFGDANAPGKDASSLPDLWEAFSDATPLHARDEDVSAAIRDRLAGLGFTPPDDAFARLAALGRSARLKSLPTTTRARLDALVPRLVAVASGAADASATLARWFDLIEAIAGRSAYLALLDEYPAVLATVTRMLAASPWAAQYLTRHPLLLDELIDAPDTDRPDRDAEAWSSYWRGVAKSLGQQLAMARGDAERQMDVLREVHHVETFRLLIDDLDGRLTIEVLSDQLSALADVIVDAAVAHCWDLYLASRADGESLPAAPAFAVIAYGKLGGKELGYASDLDLVFLFDAQGHGDAPQHYARFAQRLTNWLTVRTPAGALFDIDLRLRPDGVAGLAVSSFDAWSRYERRDHDVGAWTWEHQALTRARFSAGDRELGLAFERERVDILVSGAPDAAGRIALKAEIIAMRRRMHDGHPNRSGRFDLKHDTGGMVDIEFAVQYLVLAYGALHRELIFNVGNIALLARATAAGLIDGEDARGAADAYRLYRARQHAVRLADPASHAARVEVTAFIAERASVARLWLRLFG